MNRFPTDNEFALTQRKYPTPELDMVSHDITSDITSKFNPGSLECFLMPIEVNDWTVTLCNRMIQARDSYHLMMFYFDRSIPDARPYISPGKNGESISFLPDFQDKDHLNKASFDFYADTFFSKLYSALDTLGHLLNVIHVLNLKPKNISFTSVVEKLSELNSASGNELRELLKSYEFITLNAIRNNVTHNFPPGMFGSSVKRTYSGKDIKEISIGVGPYEASDKIVRTAEESLQLFNKALCDAGLRPPAHEKRSD